MLPSRIYHRRLNESRRHSVNPDTVLRMIDRHSSRQAHNRVLRDGVGRYFRNPCRAAYGGDVDNTASLSAALVATCQRHVRSLMDHRLELGLDTEEEAPSVDGLNGIILRDRVEHRVHAGCAADLLGVSNIFYSGA